MGPVCGEAWVEGSGACLGLCLNVSRPQSLLEMLSWDRNLDGSWASVCSLAL